MFAAANDWHPRHLAAIFASAGITKVHQRKHHVFGAPSAFAMLEA